MPAHSRPIPMLSAMLRSSSHMVVLASPRVRALGVGSLPKKYARMVLAAPAYVLWPDGYAGCCGVPGLKPGLGAHGRASGQVMYMGFSSSGRSYSTIRLPYSMGRGRREVNWRGLSHL